MPPEGAIRFGRHPRARTAGARSSLFRATVLGLFAATIALTVYFVKLGFGGIPLRAVTALLTIALVGAVEPSTLAASVRQVRTAIVVILAMAVIGTGASIAQGAEVDLIGRQLLELHVQGIIGLIVGACALRICGRIPILVVVGVVVGASAVVAALQFAGLGAAWELRAQLGTIQPTGGSEAFVTLRERAVGLSFSPVHLGTQTCLLFASIVAYLGLVDRERVLSGWDERLVLAFGFLVIASISAGNRSPLLGCIVFLGVYLAITRPVIALPAMIALVPLLVFSENILDILQELGLRVAKTEDGSTQGRRALQLLGLALIADNPFGYGFGFYSAEHWQEYWSDVRLMPNALQIARFALHNYYMNLFAKHGIFLVPIAIYVLVKILKDPVIRLAIIPYAVHIFFHNEGALQGDVLICFLIPSWLPAAREDAPIGAAAATMPRRTGRPAVHAGRPIAGPDATGDLAPAFAEHRA